MNRFVFTPFYLDRELQGAAALTRSGWRVNRPELAPGEPQRRMAHLYRSLAAAVAAALAAGERPVGVAGDCCATLGMLAGLQRAGVAPTLVWLDAHGDFNTWDTSPSGFLGGMPLAMLVGRGEQTMMEALAAVPLPESRVVLSDARDLDPDERTALEASGVTHHASLEALLDAPLPDGPIYLHIDTDVLDPEEAPAMNYPAPGGAPAALVRRVLRRLAASGRLAAVSVSLWNPALDEDGRTERLVMGLLDDLLVG